MAFADFKPAVQAGVPDILQAEIERARIDSANKKLKHQQNMDLAADAATIYDKWAGDETPIADAVARSKDYMIEALRGTPSIPEGHYNLDAGGGIDMSTQDFLSPGDVNIDPTFTAESLEGPLPGLTPEVPGVDGATGSVPIVSALRGIDALAQGDVGGAAKSAASGYLTTLGPMGMLAGGLLSLL